MSTASIYCRISDKNDNSLESQKLSCVKYCNTAKIPIKKIYMQTGTARQGNNCETLNVMIDDMNSKDVIIIASVCRFSRSVLDGLELLAKIKCKQIKIHSVTENLSYDTVHDRFNFRNHLNHAEYESDLISDRMKRSRKRSRKNVEYGFEHIDLDNGEIVVQKSSIEQHLVQEIKRRRKNGESRPSICDDFNNTNKFNRGKKWIPSKITSITSNKLGVITSSGS